MTLHILSWSRVFAAVFAMGLTLLVQVPLKAAHPPAAATALLIALGGFSLTGRDAATLLVGIGLAALLGEGRRRLRAGAG